MNVNKQSYFNSRNFKLKIQHDREALGEREVRTLLTMLRADNTPDFLSGKLVVTFDVATVTSAEHSKTEAHLIGVSMLMNAIWRRRIFPLTTKALISQFVLH